MGSNSVTFSFPFPLNRGQLLKEKNLLLVEQILSFKCRPHFGKAPSLEGHKSCFPLKKLHRNVGVYPYT